MSHQHWLTPTFLKKFKHIFLYYIKWSKKYLLVTKENNRKIASGSGLVTQWDSNFLYFPN
jgi:hypothetical protein